MMMQVCLQTGICVVVVSSAHKSSITGRLAVGLSALVVTQARSLECSSKLLLV